MTQYLLCNNCSYLSLNSPDMRHHILHNFFFPYTWILANKLGPHLVPKFGPQSCTSPRSLFEKLRWFFYTNKIADMEPMSIYPYVFQCKKSEPHFDHFKNLCSHYSINLYTLGCFNIIFQKIAPILPKWPLLWPILIMVKEVNLHFS